MPTHKIKRDISRRNLESHGIYYNEEVYRPPYILLPEHVDAVRETLLSFEGTVPEGGWKGTLRDEVKKYGSDGIGPEALLPLDSALVPTKDYEADLNDRSPQWLAAHTSLKRCEQVAEAARKLDADAEDGWMHFWRSYTFTIVSEKARDQPGFHPMLDKWVLEGNCEWTEFFNFEPNNLGRPRTRPKPDLTYAFPIVNSRLDNSRGFERDTFSRSFSIESLGILSKQGITCAPTTGLRKWTKSSDTFLRTTDLACFPWAVVEFKKQAQRPSIISSAERCYCQAANASAAALDLRAQLSTRVFNDAYSTLPPTIAFTCVGPNVKVWLTYYMEPSSNGKRVRKMVCIWSTSMRLTWGVATLRAIIMNMHTWASRLLKPQIQAWVLQALKSTHPSPKKTPNAPGIDGDLARLFSSPQVNTPNSSKLPPSTAASAALLNVDNSPCRFNGRQSVLGLQPKTPSSPTVVSSTRRIASPRTRRPMTSPFAKPTSSSRFGGYTISDPFANGSPGVGSSTDAEQRISDPTTLPNGESTKMRKPGDPVDMDQITKSFESTHLEDVADEGGSKDESPTKESATKSVGAKSRNQSSPFSNKLPRFSTASSRRTSGTFAPPSNENLKDSIPEARKTIHDYLAGQLPLLNVDSSSSRMQSGQSLMSSETQPSNSPAPIFSLKSAGFPRAEDPQYRASSPFQHSTPPVSIFSLKPAMSPHVENLQSSELTPPTSSPTPLDIFSVLAARSSSKSYVIEPKLSSGTRTMPKKDFSERLISRAEVNPNEISTASASSNLEDSDSTESRWVDDSAGIGNRSEESNDQSEHVGSDVAGSDMNATRHSMSTDKSERSDCSGSEEDCQDTKTSDLSDVDSNTQSDYEPESTSTLKDSLNNSDSEPEDLHESESDSASALDSELEDLSESESDSAGASGSEYGAHGTRRHTQALSEYDIVWKTVGLGTLDGYQLTRAPYLETLFMSRSTYRQVLMIKDVLGPGLMAGDRYWIDGQDVLGEVLGHLNAQLLSHIKKKHFLGQQVGQLQKGVVVMFGGRVTPQDRWLCFRKALSMRSRRACSDILCADSFDFTEDEWAELEDSALLHL